MGDQGNIVVESQDDGGSIYFYSHWSGYRLPQVVAAALDRGRSRWDDYPYLNRILFCELVKGDEGGETGYGISITMGDGGTEVYVNHDEQSVRYRDMTYSFSQFIDNFKDG